MAGKYEIFGRVIDRCESPIERRFAVALLFSDRFHFEIPTVPRAVASVDKDDVHLVQQVEIGRHRIDFGFMSRGVHLAVELDGHAFHHGDRKKVDRDNGRTRDLTAEGWTVIRFSGREINRDPAQCASEAYDAILQLAAGRAPIPRTPRSSYGITPLVRVTLTPEEEARRLASIEACLKAMEEAERESDRYTTKRKP